MKWQPQQYNAFRQERFTPVNDLLAALPDNNFTNIFDLGCGAGAAIAPLHDRFPKAKISGIDSDEAMLETAKTENPEAVFLHQDIDGWLESKEKLDIDPNDNMLIFSNAALHWLDQHEKLLPRIMAMLNKDSYIAIQMPNNWQEPSHKEMLALAKIEPWFAQLEPLLREKPVLSEAEYIDILAPVSQSHKVWTVTYEHKLSGPDAVLNWLKGSSLKYYLDGLDAALRPAFLENLAEKLHRAYPSDADGQVVFAFKRLFIIAQR